MRGEYEDGTVRLSTWLRLSMDKTAGTEEVRREKIPLLICLTKAWQVGILYILLRQTCALGKAAYSKERRRGGSLSVRLNEQTSVATVEPGGT